MSKSNSKNKQADANSAVTSTVVSKAGQSLLDENTATTDKTQQEKSSADFSELQNEVNTSEKSAEDNVISKDRAAKQRIIEKAKAQAAEDKAAEEQEQEAADSQIEQSEETAKDSKEPKESKESASTKQQATKQDKKSAKEDDKKSSKTDESKKGSTNKPTNNKEKSMSDASKSSTLPRRVAILGGNRIPFARSNGPYSDASNIDMLSAALNGLVERYELQGERVGEVVAGAVLKLSRDLNLTRESALNTALDPQTPAYDVSQACGTGLQATFAASNKIALGIIDSAITGGVDTTSDAPIAVGDGLRKALIKLGAAKTNKQRLAALTSINPKELIDAPQNGEPRTGLSMGDHQAITALEWNISRDRKSVV